MRWEEQWSYRFAAVGNEAGSFLECFLDVMVEALCVVFFGPELHELA